MRKNNSSNLYLSGIVILLLAIIIFLLKKANYVKLNEKLKDKNDDKK